MAPHKNKIEKKEDSNKIAAIAVFLIVFIILYAIIKKIYNSLNTESPVLDETSKKILKDKELLANYYKAIENEKKGELSNITVEEKKYRIIRAGNYREPMVVN